MKESRPDDKRGFPWKTVLLILACLLVTGLAVRSIWNRDGLSRYEAYEKEVRARGFATHPKELIPIGVPDEENSSVLWNWVGNLPKVSVKNIPVGDVSHFLQNLTPALEDEFIRAAKSNGPFLDLLRESLRRPYHTYVEQDFQRPPYEWDVVQYQGLAARYKLLFCAAVYDASEGHFEEAVSNWTLGVRSMQHFTGTPFSLISSMLGTVLLDSALDAGEILFRNDEATEEVLKEAILTLEGIDLLETLVIAYEIESTQLLQGLKPLIEGEPFKGNFDLVGRGRFQGLRDRLDSILVPLLRGTIIEKLIESHSLLLDQVEILRTDPWEWKSKLDDLSSRASERDLIERIFPSLDFSDQFEGFAQDVLTTAVRVDLFHLGLACRLYRMEHGSPPENLSQLAPEYLAEIPKDRFTGEGFKYEVIDDGFLVYGVGLNGKDEGSEGDDLAWVSDAPFSALTK